MTPTVTVGVIFMCHVSRCTSGWRNSRTSSSYRDNHCCGLPSGCQIELALNDKVVLLGLDDNGPGTIIHIGIGDLAVVRQ